MRQIAFLLIFSFFVGAEVYFSSDKIHAQDVRRETPEEEKRLQEECESAGKQKPDSMKARMSILCGKAISLPKPSFSEEAKAAKAAGVVTVEIVIDEEGRVIWAKATKGHELLQQPSVRAACRSRFTPMKVF